MQIDRPHSRSAATQRVALAVACLLSFVVAIASGTPTAQAAFDPAGVDFWVDSSMGPIKSRVFRAADGNTNRVVYALDGMRAREDLNGWEIETQVAQVLAGRNINVVMPVGGQSSFYADWNAPSSLLDVDTGSAQGSSAGSSSGSVGLQALSRGPGKSYTYMWESFLTGDLREALRARLGFNPQRNGVFGLSSGGNAALELAAYHPDQFSFAGSLSGYLNLSAPGMREGIRIAMIDAGGYNVDSMAPPWDSKWLRMDPFVFAPRLIQNNTRLWIAAASGRPTAANGPTVATVYGIGLEALTRVQTRAFQVRMLSLGARNVVFDFPEFGVHEWSQWQDQIFRMLPDLAANIG